MMKLHKTVLIVLDSVGAGSLPDASLYGDDGANTLRHVYESGYLRTPNLYGLGLGKIRGLDFEENCALAGAYGRAAEQSRGKDTTTGHWEIAGIRLEKPFPTYPNGFPADVIECFEKAIGRKTLGNKPASGTAILDELGEEHLRTGYPIVYTSADSVFQIACHEDIIPREELYRFCLIARQQLQGEHGVGRVIARPFIGTGKGSFTRTDGRRDFSLEPIGDTLLDEMKEAGLDVWGVGKIEDIFASRGLTFSVHAAGNEACIQTTLDLLDREFSGLLFVNLVDTDMIYGHRRDVKGYAEALNRFDAAVPEIMKRMSGDDLLIITADHGCDPTWKGTDHTREYVPLLCWNRHIRSGISLGTRNTFSDIAATIAEGHMLKKRFGGKSFFEKLCF